MALKPRSESSELRKLKLLDARMSLTEKEKQHLMSLIKGFEGEKQFDLLTEKLESECLILNDLLLPVNSTTIQNDATLVFGDTCHLYEVKNFEGEFHYDSDKLFKDAKNEIPNPLNQLRRSETYFRQLLQSMGLPMKVKAYVVFINPEFMMYNASSNEPFIFASQLRRHFHALNAQPSKLSRKNHILAEKLLSMHMEEYPYQKLPSYEYDTLRKGIMCEKCHSLCVTVEGYSCVCTNCGHKESVAAAIMRSVAEIKLLFPTVKITTNLVYEWCGGRLNKDRIRRILSKHFTMKGTHQWAYFE